MPPFPASQDAEGKPLFYDVRDEVWEVKSEERRRAMYYTAWIELTSMGQTLQGTEKCTRCKKGEAVLVDGKWERLEFTCRIFTKEAHQYGKRLGHRCSRCRPDGRKCESAAVAHSRSLATTTGMKKRPTATERLRNRLSHLESHLASKERVHKEKLASLRKRLSRQEALVRALSSSTGQEGTADHVNNSGVHGYRSNY